eukprot:jgi/Psemu1/246939/estExt_Genewise1.C_9060015
MKGFRRIMVLLRFLGLALTCGMNAVGAVGRSSSSSRRWRGGHQNFSFLSERLHPPRDPNPPPTIEDLEEQATINNDLVDAVLDQILGVNGGVVIDRYIPSRIWLWQQWYSSVFSNAMRNTCWKMLTSFATCCVLRRTIFGDWQVWRHPVSALGSPGIRDFTQQTQDPTAVLWLQALEFSKAIWKSLLPLTTLLLTFFVSQAYSFWVSVYLLCRNIQGRMSDIEMMLATHVERNNLRFRRRHEASSYTPKSEEFLKGVTHQLRAFHVLFWASQARRFRILLTDRGLSRLVAKGILTQQEKELLDLQLGVPKTQKHWILLESVVLKCKQAQRHDRTRQRAVLEGGLGLEQSLLDKICSLRTQCNQITNQIVARMPLSYVQFVQILVDSFLFLVPLAHYRELGLWTVLVTGILTLFYSGLLDLAYDFLDPLMDDKEYKGSGKNGENGDDHSALYFDLSVLIRESTAAAHRWINAGSKLGS